jgi:hypothetical protein
VFNSPLGIWFSSNREDTSTFDLETLPYSIPICAILAFPELMGLEVRKIIERTARWIDTRTFRVKMDLESIMLHPNKRILQQLKSTPTSTTFLEKVLSDSQQVGATYASKVLQILRPFPQGTVKSRVLRQLTMLFCRCLTNSLLLHFARLPRGSWLRRQLFGTVW